MPLFLNALSRKNQRRPPIWLMRQAGRYLPEYARIKKNRSLYSLFHDPEAIVPITSLPVEKLHVDAAILFSDILTVLDCLGQAYDYKEGTGPVLSPFVSFSQKPVIETYLFLQQAIRALKASLRVPLIGFAGGPFTVACYLLEGKNRTEFKRARQILYREPERLQQVIDPITEATIEYLQLQVDAGVDAVQIFDSWAGLLPYQEFCRWCLAPLKKICDHFRGQAPIILFCRGSSLFAPELATLAPSAISLDWNGNLKKIRSSLPSIALQGNLDPVLLYADPSAIAKAADGILNDMDKDPGYIFNLGHGILPDTPVENVQFLVDHVLNYRGKFAI